MSPLIWFTSFTLGAASLIMSIWLLRRFYQTRKDMQLIAFEVTWPRDLAYEQAVRILQAISGIAPSEDKKFNPWGLAVVVIEVQGLADGIHFILRVEPAMEDSVRNHLLSVHPAIGIQEIVSQPMTLDYALRLHRNTTNESVLDPGMASVLLSAFKGVNEGEGVVAQWVLRPTGNTVNGTEGDPYYVAGRLGARGSDRRAKELLTRALVAYRSLGIVHAQPIRRVASEWGQAPIVVWPATMTAEHLAVITAIPCGAPQIPGLVLGRGRRYSPEPSLPSTGRLLGVSNYHGTQRPIGIATEDRYRHTLLTGPTGVGKSTQILNMILGDLEDGHGLMLMENGDLCDDLLRRMNKKRLKDVIILDLAEKDVVTGFNPLQGSNSYTVMGNVLAVLDNAWKLEEKAPRAMNLLRPTLLSLSALGLTLLEIPLLLSESAAGSALRREVVASVDNGYLKDQWDNYESMDKRVKYEHAFPILHRLSSILIYPELRRTLGQAETGFDIPALLQEGKVLLVPLRKGKVGDEPAELIGTLLLSRLWQELQAIPQEKRRPFFLYVDEFYNFVGTDQKFGVMAAEARKFKLGMILSHHHYGQLSTTRGLTEDVQANVRSKLAWQTSEAKGAATVASQFGETVSAEDIQNLGRFEVLARLLTENQLSAPVTLSTMPMPPESGLETVIRAMSQHRYGKPAGEVEAAIEARKHFKRLIKPVEIPGVPEGLPILWDVEEQV